METFYLAGSADDPAYAQAELLGDLMVTRFPRVGFVKDMRHPCEWKDYRKIVTQKYGFTCPGTSVIIWRRDGRLIGTVPDFEKVVKAMYKLELKPDPDFVQKVMEENLQTSQNSTAEDKWTPYVGKHKKEWSDGLIFDGSWRDHKPYKGTVCFQKGAVYEGTLRNGLFHGQGVIKYANGAKFSGMFNDGKREGLGKFSDTDGNTFEGSYRDDECHGKGSRKWPDGRTYVGQWKVGKANGIGTEIIPGEYGFLNEYTGDFADDQRHGQGIMKYGSGDSYDGEWKQGARDGTGTFSWDTPLYFSGSFVADLPSDGKLVFEDGLTTPYPGEIERPAEDEDWIFYLSKAAAKWHEQAKERKPRTESANDTYPVSNRDKNITTQTLSEDMWNDLRGRLTSGGVALHDCLFLDHHPLGLVAGDSESLVVFRELFDPVLKSVHPKYGSSAHLSDLDPSKLKTPMVVGDIIKSCSIRVDRSVAKLPFGVVLETEERRKVEEIFAKALLGIDDPELAGDYFPLAGSESWIEKSGGMQPHEQSALEEDGLMFLKSDCIDNREWPDARGVFCSKNKQVVAHINAQEHCSLRATCSGFGIPGLFLRVVKLLRSVEKFLHDEGEAFANSSRIGYILSDLSNIGCGMTVQVSAKFPRLARRKDVASIISSFGLTLMTAIPPTPARGGKPVEFLQIGLQPSIGTPEVEMLNAVIVGAGELVRLEKALASGRRQLWLFDEQPKVLILGPPGSSHKALAESLSSACGLRLVSTSAVLEQHVQEGTNLGNEAKKCMGEGSLVSSAELQAVIVERLSVPGQHAKGWVLDGYPRTPAQIASLKGPAPNKVVLLDEDDGQLLARLAGRKCDPETGKFYGGAQVPPEDGAVAARLVNRSCDLEKGAKIRIDEYRAASVSVQAAFPNIFRVFDPAAFASPEDLAQNVTAFVQEAPY